MPLRKVFDISIEYKCLNLSISIFLCIVLLLPIAINIFNLDSISNIYINSFECFNNKIIGESCNFCGITRSILSLYKGDIVSSMKYNVGGLLFVIFIIIQVMIRFIFYISKWKYAIILDFSQGCILWVIFIKLVNLGKHV